MQSVWEGGLALPKVCSAREVQQLHHLPTSGHDDHDDDHGGDHDEDHGGDHADEDA